MKGVKVIYKPLLSLKPIDIAVICLLECPCRIKDLSGRLPLPRVILEYVLEELAIWRLVMQNGDAVELTAEGKAAFLVLQATGKNGFWECNDDGKWILGEGRFELPEALADLDLAGWDSETGEMLNEATASNAIRERQTILADSDAYASNGTCTGELDARLKYGGKFEETVQEIMARTFSALHLNRVSDQLIASVMNAESSNDANAAFLRIISARKKSRLREIQRIQRDGQQAVWVVLAQWLRQKDGTLGELIRQRPSAFRCISTIGIPLWEEEKEPATPANSRIEREQTDSATNSGGLFSWLGDMVSSIFR